jgi:hypothetical protein
LNGFQFDGGVYIVPLVYRVCARGYPASVPDEDGDADDPVLGVLLVGELVQALAVARISAAAAAAAPHRAARVPVPFPLIVFVMRLTCSYLLTRKSGGK